LPTAGVFTLADRMPNPDSLRGRYVGRGYICAEWELRAADRCVTEDLGKPSGTPLEVMPKVEIVKAFIKDRSTRTIDRGKIEPLTCGVEVWILARGNDHRGGTWYDEPEAVVWLLAYGLHRSGEPDDFFPFCRALDAEDRLLPAGEDYAAMFRERDQRFVQAVRIEAPLIVHEARETPGEHRRLLGGDTVACISVEVDREVEGEALYVAFKTETVDFNRIVVVLAAFHPVEADWGQTNSLPSRPADEDEVVFTCTRELATPVAR